ncbi:MAG: hypothetical protein N3C12_11055 [Candidatus Binatia bacterium]|nr:hypothetical protein [Candidatus Binatia bacterium]
MMEHERTVASLVGEVARTLLLARAVWGARAQLRVCDLTQITAGTETGIRRVLYVFYRSRWIWYDSERGLVGLTDRGTAALAGATEGLPFRGLDTRSLANNSG